MSIESAYLAALDGYELHRFAIDALDPKGDVPVETIAAWDADGRLLNGVGYGSDREAAKLSALGECVEAVLGLRGLPEARSQARDASCADPLTLTLPAGSTYTPDVERLWVPARRWPAGDEVLVPLEWAASTPAGLPGGYDPLITPITNGLGAHATLEQAVEHGLRELVQRDGNSVAYRALDRGMLVRELDVGGVHVLVKAAYSDLGLTNVYAVGLDDDPPHPLSITSCGEGADTDPERAIGKAVRELFASRARKPFNHGPLELIESLAPDGYLERVGEMPLDEEPRALEAMLEWLRQDAGELRARVMATFEVSGSEELPRATTKSTSELLRERGFEILVVDLSPPGDDVACAKVIVPGLEVETMSYGRIGTRNLDRLLERDIGLVGLGPSPEGALPIVRGAEEEPAWLDPGVVERRVGPLYPLYREPSRHACARALARTS